MIKHIFLGLVLFPCLVMAQLVGHESQELVLGADTIDLDGDNVTLFFGEPFTQDGVWTPGLDSAGTYVVDVTASDGDKTTTSQVEVIVENTNQAPEPYTTQVYLVEGAHVHMDMFWSDPDNDVLYHEDTEPFVDFVWDVGYDEAGVHEIELETADDEFSVEHTFIVTVEESNMKPNITGTFADSPVLAVENDTLELWVDVHDDGEYNVSWFLGNVSISDKERTQYTFDYESAGKHNLTVNVFDGKYTVTQSWEVFVEDVNRAPELDNVYAETKEGELYMITLPLQDKDGDNMTYVYPNPFSPEGTYEFDYNESGEYEFIVLASDGEFDESIRVFLTVHNVNLAPTIEIDDVFITEGQTLNWTYTMQDKDGDVLIP